MTNESFDGTLRNALMDAAWLDYENSFSDTGEEIPFSKKYIKQREKIRHSPFKYARRQSQSKSLFVLKRVAIVFITIGVLFGSLMLIPEVRAAVQRMFFDDQGSYTAVDFTSEVQNELKDRYYPTYIPEGFEETFFDDSTSIYLTYFDNSTDRIMFQYTIADVGRSIIIDSEHATPHQIIINGKEATVYTADDSEYLSYVIWLNEKEDVVFVLASEIDYIELIKMAESTMIIETIN